MLELKDLRRRYGATTALDGLSFAIPKGEVVGFLGPNGAGKTTAMRAVLGIVELDSGSISWNGQLVDHKTRRTFGYMPEERGLFPTMTVRDELVLMAQLHDMPRKAAHESVDEIVEALGLSGRVDDRVDSLSLGNQQRVQLAASLIHKPELLVLDEPFSGLDPTGIADLSKVLRRRADEGAAVMFSSHQLDLVEHFCQRVVIINRGRHVVSGTTADLTTEGDALLVVVEDDASGAWATQLAGVQVQSIENGEVRLTLEAATSDDVLNAARHAGRVMHFSLARKRLSEVFNQLVAA